MGKGPVSQAAVAIKLLLAFTVLPGCGSSGANTWDCEALEREISVLEKAVVPIMSHRVRTISTTNDCDSGGGAWLTIELTSSQAAGAVLADFRTLSWEEAAAEEMRGMMAGNGKGVKKKIDGRYVVVAIGNERTGLTTSGLVYYLDEKP
ncbi:hypothetical protein Ssi02_18420 [Sinosporangium siamense]|uniref:Lipoprotein n=1 Tax=Sinosporangium siamense TaxID=1367973 RepID=A0A919RCW5_9ACTN|nr:hypothetical protein Ssi02_18420 [Sinosporangium siamense]